MLETIAYKDKKVLGEISNRMSVIKDMEIHITIKKDVIVISSTDIIIDIIKWNMLMIHGIEEYRFDNIGI